jgi:hypothetical protein
MRPERGQMDVDARPMDKALMKRLSEAMCDVSGSPTTTEKQVEGVVRMLRQSPSGPGGPPPHSDSRGLN